MWNDRVQTHHGSPHVNARNTLQPDILSLRSISSEDVSVNTHDIHCCSPEARNPTIKKGRQLQLLQVY